MRYRRRQSPASRLSLSKKLNGNRMRPVMAAAMNIIKKNRALASRASYSPSITGPISSLGIQYGKFELADQGMRARYPHIVTLVGIGYILVPDGVTVTTVIGGGFRPKYGRFRLPPNSSFAASRNALSVRLSDWSAIVIA